MKRSYLLANVSLRPLLGEGAPVRPARRPSRKTRRAMIAQAGFRQKVRADRRAAVAAVRVAETAQERLHALTAWRDLTGLGNGEISRLIMPGIVALASHVIARPSLDERVRARLAKQAGSASVAVR